MKLAVTSVTTLFPSRSFIFGGLLRGFLEMFASLHLLAAALIGIWLLRRFLGTLLDLPEQILGGIAVGWMLAAWVAYLVAELQTRLAYGLMVGLTAFFWLVAAILWASAFRHLSVDRSAVLQQEYTCLCSCSSRLPGASIVTPSSRRAFHSSKTASTRAGPCLVTCLFISR